MALIAVSFIFVLATLLQTVSAAPASHHHMHQHIALLRQHHQQHANLVLQMRGEQILDDLVTGPLVDPRPGTVSHHDVAVDPVLGDPLFAQHVHADGTAL